MGNKGIIDEQPIDSRGDVEQLNSGNRSMMMLLSAGIIILISFLTYNYFSSRGSLDLLSTLNIDEMMDEIKSSDLEGAVEEANSKVTGGSIDRNDSTSVAHNDQSAWIATDYSPNTIEKADYTVTRGDTLWEIAEGIYGNGAMWTQIRDANSGNIGFLANGSQALIMPGQVLKIP